MTIFLQTISELRPTDGRGRTPSRALDDHSSVRTLPFLGRALRRGAAFRDQARVALRRWEDIATDFLTMGARVLVVHFEVSGEEATCLTRSNRQNKES